MHSLFCGVTVSGKTSLAKAISMALPDDARVIVYDPVSREDELQAWNASKCFSNFDEFMVCVNDERNHNAHLFIDEAGEHFGVGDKQNHWLFTRGRHYGYSVNIIAQRPKMLAPTVRTQCRRGYLFRMSPSDMDEIGQDFGHGGLGKISLDSGHCLIVDSGSKTYREVDAFSLINKGSRGIREVSQRTLKGEKIV